MASAATKKDAEELWSMEMEELTTNVDSAQERILAEILAHNAGTEYLRNCGLPTDRATFRAKVPVVSYDVVKPYIQRIANGDRSPILSTYPVTDMITSSGTSSSECRLVPSIYDAGGRLPRLQSLCTQMMNSHFPGLDKGKALYFLFVRPETKTAGGLTVWPILTSVYKSEAFRKLLSGDPFHDYTSPLAAILCTDNIQSLYAQMVCALCQRDDVLRIGAVFATTLLRAIRFLLGPLEIRVVRPGTLEELMDYTVARGGSMSQYKTPRCVTLPPVIQLLESRVVSVHVSTALSTWNPTRPYD